MKIGVIASDRRERGNLINVIYAIATASLLLGLAMTNANAAPYAYPVPFVANDPSHDLIRFKDLPGAGSIRIFTIAGEEVRKIDINPGDLILPWDLKNASGKTVATGIYLFHIDAGGQ